MEYDDLERLVSKPRLQRFLVAGGGSKNKAKLLYHGNLRLAESFYPVLSVFEVALRNRIHYNLSSLFSNPNWILTEKNGFMSHPSLSPSRYYLKTQVAKAVKKLLRQGRSVTPGRIIAEQTFGFWTALFEPHHYSLVSGSIINCFPHKPAAVNRSVIAVKLQGVREFRNRVYHNEPICFQDAQINLNDALNTISSIKELISWVDPNALDYLVEYDNVDSKISMLLGI